MSDYIPKPWRDKVAEEARHRCGYCLAVEYHCRYADGDRVHHSAVT